MTTKELRKEITNIAFEKGAVSKPMVDATMTAIKDYTDWVIGEDVNGWSNFGKRDLTEAEQAVNIEKAEQRKRSL